MVGGFLSYNIVNAKVPKGRLFMSNNPEIISSRQNKNVVELVKLSDRRARESTRSFKFDGIKLLCEALRADLPLVSAFVKASRENAIDSSMRELYGYSMDDIKCRVIRLSDELFDKISEENSPEGVITVSEYIDKFHKKYIIEEGNLPTPSDGGVLMLESLRDPVNVGAVIRSAAALGIERLVMSEDCADIYHPRTVRAAMGTLFDMPIDRVDDLAAYISSLRKEGRQVYAAALDPSACALGSFKLSRGDCVVIGNEGHGISDKVISACDRKLYIPMREGAESLNASVAAAIIMWEMRKG